jgi:hypothetical protein
MVHLTGAGIQLRGLAAQKGVLGQLEVASDWPAQVTRWREQLQSLAAAFLSGDALRDPAKDACRSCHLQVLCRTSNILEDLDEPSDE